jgi:hypothetical protein
LAIKPVVGLDTETLDVAVLENNHAAAVDCARIADVRNNYRRPACITVCLSIFTIHSHTL